jgi:hypothetical protein
MSQVLGTYGLLNFTMLQPVLTQRAFHNLWTVYLFSFPIFVLGCDKPQITEKCGYWISAYGGMTVLYLVVHTGEFVFVCVRGYMYMNCAFWCDMIYIFNHSWVDTRWQQYITHLRTNSTHNTEKGKIWECGPCPVFANYTLAFALQLRKNHGKNSVRVAHYKNNEQ